VSTGKPVGRPLPQELVNAVAFSPDGTTVVTGGGAVVTRRVDGKEVTRPEGEARLLATATGQPLGVPMPHPLVHAVAFSPGGKTVVTGGLGGARLWDAASGEPVGKPLGHGGGVLFAGRRPSEPCLVHAVAFSPDGRAVLAAGGSGAQVWDAATGKPLTGLLRPPRGSQIGDHDEIVFLAAFGADGKTFWTATACAVQCWQTATGRPVGVGWRHEATTRFPPVGLAFSPGRKRFLNGGRVWELRASPLPGEKDAAPLRAPADRILLWLEVRTGESLPAPLAGAHQVGPPWPLTLEEWQERRKRLARLGGLGE
jgi:WD40 repeat protein